MDETVPRPRRGTRREWVGFWLLSVPAWLSTVASVALLVSFLFGEVELAAVGGPLGAGAVSVWRQRPGGVDGAADDRPTRRADRGAVVLCAVVLVVDLVVAVLVPLTGRLPAWAGWTAVALLVVHVSLAVRVVRRVRARRTARPTGYDAPAPRARELRWRSTPEPLRSVSALAVAATAVAFVVFGLGAFVGGGAVWQTAATTVVALALALLGAVIAFDVRGSARERIRRLQRQRSSSRHPLSDSAAARQLVLLRGCGAFLVLVGVGLVWLDLAARR